MYWAQPKFGLPKKKPKFGFISTQTGMGKFEKEIKKNFIPSTILTQPKQEHSQKNRKKLKKGYSGYVSSQTKLGEAKK